MPRKRNTTTGPKSYAKREKRPLSTAMPHADLIIDREADVTIRFFEAEGDVIISQKQHGVSC